MKSLFYRRASEENIKNLKRFLQYDEPRFMAQYKTSLRHGVTLHNFHKITTLGFGTFGRVYLVREKQTHIYYAMKQISKKDIVERALVDQTLQEKRVLQSTNFPFLVYLKYFFTDNSNIYFVLPFLIGGELFNLLRKNKKFDEDLSKFYAAQLVLALEYLHYMKIVYRDLKPENVLIDESGYLKITDFGLSKIINDRTYTLCGTPEYLAPEILLNKGYGLAADWWSFGVFIYEMNNGEPPFQHWDRIILFENITKGEFTSPSEFSDSLKDILDKLITVDLSKRLGNLINGVDDIKRHKWFSHIIWLRILNREAKAPYKPKPSDPKNAVNFRHVSNESISIANKEEFPKIFSNF